MTPCPHCGALPSAHEDAKASEVATESPQTRSPSFKLAYQDTELLLRDELRGVRLQLELIKPELVLTEHGIRSTVVFFGSTRIPEPDEAKRRLEEARRALAADPDNPALQRQLGIAERILAKSHYYEDARALARLVSLGGGDGERHFVVVTGGGPGIMEAANRGAHDVGAPSVGFNIVLPHEQRPNRYITPELTFQFHYFAIRKMHFLMRARALVVFPGGFGTMDELFETLTLIQTGKSRPIPVLLFGRDYWQRIVDFDAMVEEGTIDPADKEIFRFVDDPEAAWSMIREAYAEA